MKQSVASIILFSTLVIGAVALSGAVVQAQEFPSVVYYWGVGCPHCAQVAPFLEELQNRYPSLTIDKREVYQNADNARQYIADVNRLAIPPQEQGVPMVIVDDRYLTGDVPIINNLESILLERRTPSSPVVVPDAQSDRSPLSLFIAISGAALVDAINPCAITVLVILLAALLVAGDRRRALWGGLSFATAIYIAYFLFGIGIVYTISLTSATLWVQRIVGVIAILIGLANLKDFFWYGKGFVMEIPLRWRPTLQRMLRRVTSPVGAFLMGFAVTAFELPCTGGPYFFALGLLSQEYSWSGIVPLLLYYNLLFVSPLLILIGLVWAGRTTTQRIADYKNHNIRLLHLITGVVMIALGLWVLL